jgi:hypothetical protein
MERRLKMKTFIAVLAAAAMLVIGAMAYAHGTGAGGSGGGHMMGGYGGHMMGQGYGGHMMGQGYGGHMMGQGYGGHMMGPGYGGHMKDREGPGYGADKEFLDETADLRKALHEKKFEYFEASRNPETDPATLTKLDKELYEIKSKIREKAPRGSDGGSGGYGHCW